MADNDGPDRFFLQYLDQTNIVLPDGTKMPFDQYVREHGGSDSRATDTRGRGRFGISRRRRQASE